LLRKSPKHIKIRETPGKTLFGYHRSLTNFKDVRMAKRGDRALQRAEEYRREGLSEMAADSYREAIALFKEDHDVLQRADALSSLGKLYGQQLFDHRKALKSYQESLRLRQMYGLERLSEEYFNVAEQQNFLGSLSEAKDNLMRGMHSAEREGNQQNVGKILNLLGDILVEEGNLNEAEEHLRTSLEVLTAEGDQLMISNVQSSIGLLLACRHKYEDALKACQNALDQAEMISAESSIGIAQLRFGQVHWMQGSFSTARDYFSKALEIAQRTEGKILRETALEWLDRCGLERPPRSLPPEQT
jgi:tetratricopeptide (TPR) repeat protein